MSSVSLSGDLLLEICYYAPEELLVNLLQTTRFASKYIIDPLFWRTLLLRRNYRIQENILLDDRTFFARIFFAINDRFGYVLLHNGNIVFNEAVSSYIISSEYIWLITTSGKLFCKALSTMTYSSHSGWHLFIIDEKIRSLRGLLSENRILAIGDDSVLIADANTHTMISVSDNDKIDYYVENEENVMGFIDDNNLIGVTLQGRQDAIDIIVLSQPIETLLERIDSMGLYSARHAMGFSFGKHGEQSYSIPLTVRISDPTQTREENQIIYYEGGYDAEGVKDIVSEYDNSEHYGEDGGL